MPRRILKRPSPRTDIASSSPTTRLFRRRDRCASASGRIPNDRATMRREDLSPVGGFDASRKTSIAQTIFSICPARLSCSPRDAVWLPAPTIGFPGRRPWFAPFPSSAPTVLADSHLFPKGDRLSHECVVPHGPWVVGCSFADLQITTSLFLHYPRNAAKVLVSFSLLAPLGSVYGNPPIQQRSGDSAQRCWGFPIGYL